MSKDENKAKELESEASQLIDGAPTDEEALDRAAEILAKAEQLEPTPPGKRTGSAKIDKKRKK